MPNYTPKANDAVVQTSTDLQFTVVSVAGATATVKNDKGVQSHIPLSDLKPAS